jgi:hypothetical protein
LQDIELARISQEAAERFYNLVAVGEGGRCPAQKLLKARILLKADASDDGEGWSDGAAEARLIALA